MGLDMRLEKRNYVKNWEHMRDEEKHTITIKRGGKVRKDIKPERVSYVTEELMYWRKANHIHNWFLDNCAQGYDDYNGVDIWVSFEKLCELRDICERIVKEAPLIDGKVRNGYTMKKNETTGKIEREYNVEDGKIVANVALCEELLPTADGFFWGGTDYDQWYYNDVLETFEMLRELTNEPDASRADYYYNGDW